MGGMTVLLVGAVISVGLEAREEYEEVEEESHDNVVVTNFSNRFHQLYCQQCRKIKNHREIETRVFECNKCKRRTNLKLG